MRFGAGRVRGLTAGAVVVVAVGSVIAFGWWGPAAAETSPLERACPDPVPQTGFDDVASGATHAASIECLAAWELTEGVGGGMFDPHSAVPREQMATFLVKLLEAAGADLPTVTVPRFDDVGGVHADNVEVLAELEIVHGRAAGEFAPAEPVSCAGTATMLAGVLDELGVDLPDEPPPFEDAETSVHASAIGALAALEIVSGTTPDQFAPWQPVTREQMASLLMHAAGLLVEEDIASPPYLDEEEVEDPVFVTTWDTTHHR